MKWKPIKSVPKKGEFVLIYNPCGGEWWKGESGVYIAQYDRKSKAFVVMRDDVRDFVYEPSHWMPLPSQPKTPKKAEKRK
jgi:hypothetical protein